MNPAHIKKRVEGGGFRPFALRTSDGREYPVPHPDFIWFTKALICVADEEGSVFVLDPLHVTAVQDLPIKQDSGD
jgi:hypothetical protein